MDLLVTQIISCFCFRRAECRHLFASRRPIHSLIHSSPYSSLRSDGKHYSFYRMLIKFSPSNFHYMKIGVSVRSQQWELLLAPLFWRRYAVMYLIYPILAVNLLAQCGHVRTPRSPSQSVRAALFRSSPTCSLQEWKKGYSRIFNYLTIYVYIPRSTPWRS